MPNLTTMLDDPIHAKHINNLNHLAVEDNSRNSRPLLFERLDMKQSNDRLEKTNLFALSLPPIKRCGDVSFAVFEESDHGWCPG